MEEPSRAIIDNKASGSTPLARRSRSDSVWAALGVPVGGVGGVVGVAAWADKGDKGDAGASGTLLGATDYVWGVNSQGHIFRCKAPCANNVWQQMNGSLKQIDVGKEYVYGTNMNDNIYRCKLPCDTSAWEGISGSLKEISGP